MGEWLYPAGGALLLLLLATDVFQTAFHAEGRGGPIHRKQNRLIWNAVRWAATVGGRTRPQLLSIGGPVIAIATIATWSILLLAGFSLIYLPYVLDFHFSPGQPGSAIVEAFYYSGIIAATVGQGDVVAPGSTLRMLTILEAVSGYALVTVAVTYVLAVYRELIDSQALASAMEARLPWGPETNEAGVDLDPEWARSITLRLSHVLEAHYNYPILHYFRPSRSARALPFQVARLLATGGEGSERRDGTPAPSAAGSGSRRALRAMIRRYIAEVHRLFVDQEREPGEDLDDERARLEEILSMMVYDQPDPRG